MALPPKLCPQCGEEYLHSVERCGACDVALVLEEQLEAAPAPELPPSSELRSIRTASAGWALTLSERLVDAGIPHRVEALSDEGARPVGREPYGVFVRPEDVERARALDAAQMASEIPDLPEGWESPEEAGEGCPACGSPVPDGAAECPDCGLALALPE